jgi:hypothetical protein
MADIEMKEVDNIIDQIDQDETDTQYNSENENDDDVDSQLDLNNKTQLLSFLLRNNKHASTLLVLLILFTTIISVLSDLYKKFYKEEMKIDEIIYEFHSTNYSLFNNETASNVQPFF